MIRYALAWQPESRNLGDDLRTLAAMQYLPQVDLVLDVDRLDAPIDGLAEDDRVVTLITGSVLKEAAHWPPERHIAPVFAGVHISREDVWGVPFSAIGGEGRHYLEACAPLACRDRRTSALMEEIGLPCQVTACVTLTLTKPDVEKGGYVCCVDVPGEVCQALRDACGDSLILHESSHTVEDPSPDFDTRMAAARQALEAYAGADWVITRRLHCAMACLAVGTPVILLYNSGGEDPDRFAPMDEMLRAIPTEDFLHTLRAGAFAPPADNPEGLDAWQAQLRQTIGEGVVSARHMPLPLVEEAAALAWRQDQLSLAAQCSAQKIRRLESERYQSLHEKFSIILKEDAVKGSLSALMDEKEIRRALRRVARRQLLASLPWYRRPLAWVKLTSGRLKAEDLHQYAMDQLSALGWPEHPQCSTARLMQPVRRVFAAPAIRRLFKFSSYCAGNILSVWVEPLSHPAEKEYNAFCQRPCQMSNTGAYQ